MKKLGRPEGSIASLGEFESKIPIGSEFYIVEFYNMQIRSYKAVRKLPSGKDQSLSQEEPDKWFFAKNEDASYVKIRSVLDFNIIRNTYNDHHVFDNESKAKDYYEVVRGEEHVRQI